MPAAIKTINGTFLTVVNGGGLGGPNSGPGSVALHTDAISIGSWEKFTNVGVALQTLTRNFVGAVNGGGMGGGQNSAACPVHTDAKFIGPEEVFTILPQTDGTIAIQTPSGNYVTAVNGGGFSELANQTPIHTDATKIGAWETLVLIQEVFFLKILDARNGLPISDFVCQFTSSPFTFGPVFNPNLQTYVMAMPPNTTMLWWNLDYADVSVSNIAPDGSLLASATVNAQYIPEL